VKIISNYITALNFSKKTVVLLHKLIHDYIIKAQPPLVVENITD